jgi:hypothetical protein
VRLSKYGNRKVICNGGTFDSKRELQRYQELLLLQKAGQICCLERQPSFELVPGVVLYGRKRPPLKYTADFSYFVTARGLEVIEDVKSKASRTEAYIIRRHLMRHVHGMEITEVE